MLVVLRDSKSLEAAFTSTGFDQTTLSEVVLNRAIPFWSYLAYTFIFQMSCVS